MVFRVTSTMQQRQAQLAKQESSKCSSNFAAATYLRGSGSIGLDLKFDSVRFKAAGLSVVFWDTAVQWQVPMPAERTALLSAASLRSSISAGVHQLHIRL